MSGWFSVTAHISAVCARTVSLALTLAPRSSNSVTASILPVRAAVMSAVSPPGVAVFGIGAGVEQPAHDRGVPVERRQAHWRDAVPRCGLHIGAALDQRVDCLEIVLADRLMQGRGPVRRCGLSDDDVTRLRHDGRRGSAHETEQRPGDQHVVTPVLPAHPSYPFPTSPSDRTEHILRSTRARHDGSCRGSVDDVLDLR